MRVALRGKQFREALVICQRITHTLRTRIDDSAAPQSTPRVAANGSEGDGRVRLSKIAHRVGVDPRTLRRHIEKEDFVEHPCPRVWLVYEARFDRWYTARGRKL